jgi:TRAP-type transport system periplasmic protein
MRSKHLGHHRRLLGAGMLALAASCYGVAPAAAQGGNFTEMTLRSAQVLVSKGFASEAHQWWADEIKKRTGGKVKIEIYWSGSLIAPRDIAAAVASGGVEIGHVASTYDPARARLWMTLDMPLNVKDLYCGMVSARKVSLENEHLQAEFKRNNMIPLVAYNSGWQQYISKTPLDKIADLKGKRMRSYGGTRIDLHKHLGITPVFMPFGEIYEAIERGVIDGSTDVAIYLSNAFKLHEVAKNFLVTNSGVAVAAPMAVMNRAKWDSLPENLKTVIREVSEEHDRKFAQELIHQEKTLLKEYESNASLRVKHLTAEDTATLEAAAKKVHEDWIKASEAGGRPAGTVWASFQKMQRDCEAEVKAKGYPWGK